MKHDLHRPNSPRFLPSLQELWRLRMVHTDLHYLNEFLRRHAAADLLALRVFPKEAAKEITESAALRCAAMEYLGCDPKDPNIVAVCPGDGASPRTAALIAFTTAWTAIAIDPELWRWHARWPGGVNINGRPVERLHTVAAKVEAEAGAVKLQPGQRAVVLACHSHADLPASLATIELCNGQQPSSIGVAAMSCCVPQTLPGREHDHEYEDTGVWSPHRIVRVWRPRA